MVSPFLPDDEKVAAVRAAIPAVDAGIYVDTGFAGPLPAETASAMAELADWELRVGRAHRDETDETLVRMEEARAAVAAIIGGGVTSVALTHSTTDGLNAAAGSLEWRPGDRAVTTNAEHPGGLAPLVALRDRLGVEIGFVDVGLAEETDDEIVRRFAAAIDERTRLLSLSHVTWTTGRVLPVTRIAEVAREHGAFVLVDGAQAAGAIPVDVGTLGADGYALPARKWLLGPDGMGALWISPGALGRMWPPLAGALSFETLLPDGTAGWWPDARRFEATSFHRPSMVGLARSCGWLAMYVGLDFVHRRGAALARLAADRLAAIPGVTLLTPRDAMGTLVTFRVAGWSADAALDELGARVFAIARSIAALDAVRFSVGFFNTEAEVEQLVECVALLAAHTPATIPARRRLTVLGST